MRIVNLQQTIIPPPSSQRQSALFARRANDIVMPSPRASSRDDQAADAEPVRGRIVDILA